ncbi:MULTISPECIES: ThiF family adenylyltransferase [unclassified Streptomyces]|uniref:ThiF family adenylyltransferase n=1 Tax=unclassified Streptomyces TaxID=2593676 RepID=UPI0013A6BE59|nr:MULTISPECIES: ThiF family adenylyltransferase [unclassified Streptomyces]
MTGDGGASGDEGVYGDGDVNGTGEAPLLDRLRRRFPAGVMLRANTTIAAGEAGELLVIGENGFGIDGADDGLRELAGRLAGGLAWPDGRGALSPRQLALLEVFEARGMLVPLPRAGSADQYTKQRHWLAHFDPRPEDAMERIARHRAVVVGCGGTGSIVATHLCAMGVRDLLLVDHDRVEITNFNRQFSYRRRDLGRPKTEALRDFLRERYPDAEISASQVFVDEDTVGGLGGAGGAGGPGGTGDPGGPGSRGSWTLFCCADRPVGTLALLLAAHARAHGGAVIFAAAGLEEAAVGPLLLPEADAAHREFAREMAELGAFARTTLADPVMSASIAPVNTVTAAWMVGEWTNGVILSRATRASNARFVVDLGNSTTREERTWG